MVTTLSAKIKPTKHNAPGQYLGFALQPVRAFYHLLTAPQGAKVALELQDDVSIHYGYCPVLDVASAGRLRF